MVTSGAATKRIDRLVDRGLVTRRVSDVDTRRRVVTLTEEGRALIDQAFEAHIANEHRLVGPLSQKDRIQLASLLQEWGEALGA
jgi:DNA-binding MarR family transcriptional regulator